MNNFDIAIIGGGLVGLATACALINDNESYDRGLRIAVIDKGVAPDYLAINKDAFPNAITSFNEIIPFDEPTVRASAINGASQRYFKQIGIWDALSHSHRVQDFLSIEVWEKIGSAYLHANCRDYGYPNLGCIIENKMIHYYLMQFAARSPQITFFNQQCVNSLFADDYAFLTLSDNTVLQAKLVIGADGAHSWIRQQEAIPLIERNYRHHAVITTVTTEFPHQACARQLFYPDGIVAFLPLYQPNKSCLVWSTSPEQAEALQTMSADQFSAELFALTGDKVGVSHIVNERLRFPLKARFAKRFVKHRLVLIGDAAHTIHPLAGQGVNLGFQDSALLTSTIKALHQSGQDIGMSCHFRAFQFTRRKDTLMMMAAMRTIQDMFDGQSSVKKWLRAAGMNTINHLSPLKKQLIKYAID
ncbi:FAD-dependent monooxygenase [Orbaceae bacterium ESL0727]|nr:FAD-dependent monooxygenase [Orbaceae bacterium ESL0727]